MSQLRIDRVLGFEHGVPPVFGVVAAVVGLLFLLLGWRLHRFTVAVVGFALGAAIGQLIARWIQVERLWGVLVGGASFALLAEPLHRVAVFGLSGLALGAVAGEGVRLFAPSGFLWGFAPGFLAGGLLSLWQLRLLVILSTALVGAVAVFWGGAVAGGAWLYRPAATFHVRHPLMTTIMIGLLFVVGSAIQFGLSPKSKPEEED